MPKKGFNEKTSDRQMEVYSDLVIAQKLAYGPSCIMVKNVLLEAEGHDYGACEFEIGTRLIKFRTAKITPTKVGQFVTLWKREGHGPIMPFDMADSAEESSIGAIYFS